MVVDIEYVIPRTETCQLSQCTILSRLVRYELRHDWISGVQIAMNGAMKVVQEPWGQ
jgi:hypothetical protein